MSDFSFRFFIIENGGGVSQNYYRFVPREPSPDGGYLVNNGYQHVETNMTVSSLLDEMIKMEGGYLLVLCHGSPRHVSIPLTTKTPKRTLDEEVIDTLEKLVPVDTDIAKIESMRESNGDERVKKIDKINDVMSKVGIRERFSDIQTANARLSDFVKQSALDLFRDKSPAAIASMWELVGKAKKVKQFRFKRVEFRACRVGSNLLLMRKLRQLFNCDALTAPKFRVMRSVQRTGFVIPAVHFPERQRFLTRFTPDTSPAMAFCKPCGVSRRPMVGSLSSVLKKPATKDGLADHVVGDNATRTFSSSNGLKVDINVKIVSELPSAFDFTIPGFNVKGNDPNFNIFDLFEVFHRQFIYDGAVIAVQTVIIGGMWLGNPDGYVLANEPGYLANLVTVRR